MEGSPKKKAASGKEKDRVPAFIRDLLDKCRSSNIEEFILPAVLNQKPKIGQPWSTYMTDKESVSGHSNVVFDEIIKVYLVFPNYDKSGHVQKIFLKQCRISSHFLSTLCSVLPKYDHISTLKLTDCNLSKQAIEILHSNLVEMPNIVEIALDGNPITAQNQGLLASSDSIRYLSLKRCKLNEIGIMFLYENLVKVQQSNLQILNLTGNYIDDSAAVGVEKILRENRSITTLILADNWITDIGCYGIMSALQSFLLTDAEIVKRRSITINYIRQKLKVAEEYKKDKLHVKLPPTPPPSAKSKRQGKSKKKDGGRKSLYYNEMNKQVSDYVENILPKITHPFIVETQSINGELVSSGNLILGFLSLAFNKLTLKSYKYILEVLNYQFTKEQQGSGLSYIVLNGNADLQSIEFDDVSRLIIEKLWRTEKRQRSKASAEVEELYLSSGNSV